MTDLYLFSFVRPQFYFQSTIYIVYIKGRPKRVAARCAIVRLHIGELFHILVGIYQLVSLGRLVIIRWNEYTNGKT